MSESPSYTQELQQKLVRDKLNQEKIKLWLPPYTQENGEKGTIPQDMVERFSTDLSLSPDTIQEVLETLRLHALQKLAERERFQKSGTATVRVKVAGNKMAITKQMLTIEIVLSSSGRDLRCLVSEKVGLPVEQAKLICQGRIIVDGPSLKDQNVKHGSQMMLLCLSVSEAEAQRQQEQASQLLQMRHAAELLSDRVQSGNDDKFDVQIADQSGRPLKLPAEEQKALTLAMTFHEKGRTALKKKEVTMALPLLLEADKEFKRCRSDILNAVDNYAVLCLDIVWCYLCLKTVEELPDADQRLHTSEMCFHKSYGSDLERLTAVKGETGSQLALFVRLHLLQGIVAFHQHKLEEAHRHITRAEAELQRLQIDEESLTAVMSMGFSEREARLSLRACGGNVRGAVANIMKRREEKEEGRRKVKEEKRKKKLAKSLGKTASGDVVNVDNYEMLVSMGFSKGAACEAIRQANNDVSQALEVLQTHPELLSLPDPGQNSVVITDDAIAQVTGMGFEPDMAKRALQKHRGNVERAINDLVQSGGVLPPTPEDMAASSSSSESTASSSTESPGSSSLSSGSSKSSSPSKTREEIEREDEEIGRLVSDIPEDEDDYLDISLTEEAQFLQEYKTLLQSVQR